MKVVGLMTLLALTGVAYADDEPAVADQARTAREAALRGNCDDVLTIAGHVWAVDPTYYNATFLADPAINACLVVQQPAPQAPVVEPAHRDVWKTAVGPKPPLSPGRVVGELLLGAGTSAVAGFVGGVAGASLADCRNSASESCQIGGALVGGSLGLAIGAPVGVYLVGGAGSETGSLGAAYGWAACGLGVSAAVALALKPKVTPSGGIIMLLATPTIGATIGFNLTRRYDQVTVAPVVTGQTIGVAGTF